MSSLFIKIEANMVDHPKMIGISGEAKWSLVEMVLYSQAHLTDGFIDERVASRKWSEEAIGELLSNDPVNPSISKADGGYQIHNYTDYQRSAEEVESILESKRAAGAKGGKASGEARRIKAEAKLKQNEANAKQTRSETKPDTEAYTDTDTEITNNLNNVAQERHDVQILCETLADLIVANGSKKPTVGKSWLDAARLLLDSDERDLQDALSLLKWSQQHDFWKSNILSMPTFRKQYDKLRLQRDGELNDPRTKSVIGRGAFYDGNGILRGPNDWQQADGRWVQG